MSAMTPERWQQVKEVLAQALETHGAARAELLARVGAGDPALRSEVEELLAGELAADSLTSAVAAVVVSATEDATSELGTLVGPYRLEAEVGRGGMGTVYLARRADGQYDARVAVKLVRRDMDGAEAANRFRLERQYLAVLEHPFIARLLDGGVTADGRLYLVLEYVDGEPIDVHCTARALGLEARLRLFCQVCAAVEYAHQRLIVHRDLKPSNVLVGSGGTPKVVDFGIAKLLVPGPGAPTTQDASRFLTPAYASPEHRAGGPITTASDVYSLGVLLHQLLAGRLPHTGAVEAGGSPAEAIPVSAAAALDGGLTAGIEAGRLRGDLDRIVAKALRTSPEERYRSAADLEEDIRRFLAGEPIRARPPTLGYRLGKWAARNRALAATLVISVALSLLGVAGIAWEGHRASVARVAAEQAEQRARRRFEDVRRLAHAVIYDYSDAIEQLSGSVGVRERLVRDALDYLGSLAADSSGDVGLQTELAAAYIKIGDIQGRRGGGSNLGRVAEAQESYRKAAALYEAIGREGPRDFDHQLQMARVWTGPFAFSSLAHNDVAGALAAGRRGVAIAEQLARARPDDERVQALLVEIEQKWIDVYLSILADTKEAHVHAERCGQLARARAQAHPQELEPEVSLAYCDGALGGTLAELGRHREAVEHKRKSVERSQRLLTAHPEGAYRVVDVAVALARLGVELADEGSSVEALEVSGRAERLMKKVYEANRDNGAARYRLSQVLRMRARATLEAGRLAEAAAASERSLELARELDDANAGVITYVADLAAAELLRGEVLERLGRLADARSAYRAAYDGLLRLTASPEQRQGRWLQARARALEAAADSAPKSLAFRKAVEDLEALAAQDPSSVAKQREVVRLYRRLARREGERSPRAFGECEGRPWTRKAAALSKAIEDAGLWLGAENSPDLRACR